jgi:hypothetical protein
MKILFKIVDIIATAMACFWLAILAFWLEKFYYSGFFSTA